MKERGIEKRWREMKERIKRILEKGSGEKEGRKRGEWMKGVKKERER